MNPEASGTLVQGLSGALLVGLAGFLYLHSSYFQRFRHSAAGQQTKASLSFAFGVGFLLLTSILMAWMHSISPSTIEKLHEWWVLITPVHGLAANFIAAPGVALVTGILENVIRLVVASDDPHLNQSHPLFTYSLRERMRLAALGEFAKKTDDRLLATLWRAMTLGKLIQVTLKGRKVYIGSPLALSDPSVESRWLKLIPIASGYRDSDTLSYIPTTDYRLLFDELAGVSPAEGPLLPADFDRDDLGVLICWAEIVSLTIYAPALEGFFGTQFMEPEDAGGLGDVGGVGAINSVESREKHG